MSYEDVEMMRHSIMNNKYRYRIVVFPAYLGNPVWTNSRIWAKVVTRWRALFHVEARLIDNVLNEHILIL